MKKLFTLSLTLVFTLSLLLTTALAADPDTNIYTEAFLAASNLNLYQTTAAHRLDSTVNEALVATRWDGGLENLLAESYEMQEDGQVFVFHLRQGVTWHDGTPFTAQDVVTSLNLMGSPQVASIWNARVSDVNGYDEFAAGEADSLAGVTAPDDYTVRVELKNPVPLWPKLKAAHVPIVPHHILGVIPPEDVGSSDYWSQRVGTGPFKWVEYKVGDYIKLEANEDYWGGKPEIDTMYYKFFTSAETQVAALESGEIDMTVYESTVIGLNEIERLNALPNVQVVPMNTGKPVYLKFNYHKEFADARIRQAIAYAIDKQALVDEIMGGNGMVADALFPQPWTWPDDMVKYEYNPDKARELLKEAGWVDREVDFIYYYQDPINADLIVAIQQYLADVGFTIVPRYADDATINQMYADDSFDIGYFGFGGGLDPSLFIGTLECGNKQALNFCRPELDELYAEGLKYATQEERAPIYQEIVREFAKEANWVMLYYDVRPLGFSTRVEGPYEHYSQQPVIFFNTGVYNEIQNWTIKE